MLGTLGSQTRAATQEILTTPIKYEETKWTVKKIAHAKIDNNTVMFPVVEYTGDIPFGKEESKDFKMHSVAAERKIKKHDIPLFDLKQAKLVTTKLLVNLHGYGLAEIQKAYMSSNLKFPYKTALTCKEWVGIILSINKIIPYLTTYKDDPAHKNHPDIKKENVEFNEVELCAIVIKSMPGHIIEALKVQNPSVTLYTELSSLVANLDAIIASERSKAKATARTNPAPTNQQSGRNKRKNGGGGNDDNDERPTPANPKGGTGCSKCKNAGRGAWYNHITSACKAKFDANGQMIRGRSNQIHNTDLAAENKELRERLDRLEKCQDRYDDRGRRRGSDRGRGRDHDNYRHSRSCSKSRSCSRSRSRSRSDSRYHR